MSEFFVSILGSDSYTQECITCDSSCHCDCDSANCECNTCNS